LKTVLLIEPRKHFCDIVNRELPLGLLTIASMIEKEYEVVIIDQRIDGWCDKLLKTIKKGPLCAGITVVTGKQIHYALQISKIIRDNSNTKIVWGGIHPTLSPIQTLENKYVDVVVEGEGEIVFKEIINRIELNKSLEGINGVWFKKNGKITGEHLSKTSIDLNLIPQLPYYLVDLQNYQSKSNKNDIFRIEAGRGCVHRCVFCYHTGMPYNGHRMVSAEKIIEKIIHIKKYAKIDKVRLIDDTFFLEKERVLEFIRLLKLNKINIKWEAEANLNDIKKLNDEEITELQGSGLRQIQIGVDSGSEKILRFLNKSLDLNCLKKENKRLNKYNIQIKYNFLVGYIGEDIEDLKCTTKLIDDLEKENVKASTQVINIVLPFPNTKYYELAVKNGYEAPRHLEEWVYLDHNMLHMKMLPWFSKEKLGIYDMLKLTSFVVGNNTDSNLIKLLFKLYYPIAKYRFKHLFYRFTVEVKIFSTIKKIIIKIME
jgi:anaerobic magnesium-protoporphyrin IX monomethyl ester cyclase